MDWYENNSFLKGIINKMGKISDPIRIASFDLDDTIIYRPKGKLDDKKWKIINLSIVDKIADLVNDKYIIIIFTNQGGMSIGKNFDKLKWRKAVDELVNFLVSKITDDKYYFAIYVAKNYDLNRKPNIGLWNQMKNDLKEEFNLEKLRISKKSFFCGDAAGRISASIFKKKIYPSSNKGDFSDTDRKFALNIGINFLTPEEFYLDNAPKMQYELVGIDPNQLIEQVISNKYKFKPREKEMIIMVGPPGSGKSEFVKKYILSYKYIHINQDMCKTKAKCMNLTKEALEKNKSIVIDNTNPDISTRMSFTTMALEHDYKHIRAIIMNTDEAVAKHMNNVRHVYSNGIIPHVNNIAYNIYKKKYVRPQKSEHFDKIETVDFIFDSKHLDDPLWKKIFMRWSSRFFI